MDKVVKSIVALGVPGFIFLYVISTSGLAGAAAVTAALSTFGGPFGMLGGIGAIGIGVLISKGIAEYGFDAIAIRVMEEFYSKGKTKKDILDKIDSYPISKDLKRKLKEKLNEISAKNKK